VPFTALPWVAVTPAIPFLWSLPSASPKRALIAACDELHASSDISDATWTELKKHFSGEQAIEILMLAGRYKVVSYLTNAIRMPLETWARRFPQ
jgi:alkylhydroperoxidase family enzyme